jgi:hypothetical protein
MDPAIPPSGILAGQPEDQGPDVPSCRRAAGPAAYGAGGPRRRATSRCQRTIVSGVTSSRSPWRRALGITPSRVASRALSAQFRFGRHGCCRCSTASWWRRIKISAIRQASLRRDSRSHVAVRVTRRKTNRRHMTGDHHGQAAGTASLLVRAVDGILGTHKLGGGSAVRVRWARAQSLPDPPGTAVTRNQPGVLRRAELSQRAQSASTRAGMTWCRSPMTA